MKTIFLLIAISFSSWSLAQSPLVESKTRAVVIGISDYQDKGIPDLYFAHKDAEAFANYLRSEAGGSLQENQIKLLVNEDATAGKIGAALYWLIEKSQLDDQVIIYFSGHGDVEKILRGQPGYLLCWDSPASVYIGGGTLRLLDLQSIVSTLSIDNESKVLVITDACRSGNLAGSAINGSQVTNANLAQLYANEIKILSCQSNEYSIEGKQWGGGHGAFSYHLINGLYGMADNDEDLQVTLSEIDRYLENKVSEEVAPRKQLPFTIGNRRARIAIVDEAVLAEIIKETKTLIQPFTGTDSKGLEDEVLASLDSTKQELYAAFKQALEKKIFLEPMDACAEMYFNQLVQDPALEELHNTMRRNYAAALQDDSQQALNAYLVADSLEMAQRYNKDPKYHQYPQYLKRAANLLGEKHYIYHSLLARNLYFEGLSLRMESTSHGKRDSLYLLALSKQEEALKLEPNAPYIVLEIGKLQRYLKNYEEALDKYNQACHLAPNWITPVLDISSLYRYYLYDNIESISFAQKAIDLDSTSFDAYMALAKSFYFASEPDSAIMVYEEILKRWPEIVKSYLNYSTFLWETKRIDEAIDILSKGMDQFPNEMIFHYEMGRIHHFGTFNPDLAEKHFLKAIELDSTFVYCYLLLGQIYGNQGKIDSSLAILHRGLEINPQYSALVSQIARIYENANDFPNAEKYYLKSLEINPRAAYAYGRIGTIKFKYYKDTLAAKQYFKKASKLNPQWGSTGLAEIYFIENKPDSAFIVIDQKIKAVPTWFEGYYWNARLFIRYGYFDEAIDQYNKLLEFNPKFPPGLFEICKIQQLMGQLDSAIYSISKLIEFYPEDEFSIWELSQIYIKKGRVNDALNLLSESLEKQPNGILYSGLAEIYWLKRDSTKAFFNYNKVIDSGINNPYYEYMLCVAKYRLNNNNTLISCMQDDPSNNYDKMFRNAAFYSLIDKPEEANKWLKKAFEKGFDRYEVILISTVFNNVVDTSGFEELKKEYFPKRLLEAIEKAKK